MRQRQPPRPCHRPPPLDPSPAQAVAVFDASPTAAGDEAARSAAIHLPPAVFGGGAATAIFVKETSLIAVGFPTPPAPIVASPCFLYEKEEEKLSQPVLDTSTTDVEAFLSTPVGHKWLAEPLPRTDQQAYHWLPDTGQGHAWLFGPQGTQWAAMSEAAG